MSADSRASGRACVRNALPVSSAMRRASASPRVSSASAMRSSSRPRSVMTERVVTMFLLSTPFQASCSMPTAVARMLSGDLLNACDQLGQGMWTVGHFVGNSYTIADISTWGWIDRASRVLKGEGDPLAPYPNIKRWFEAIKARPAVARARAVGTEHSFKQERDEEALRALFPSNYPVVA